MPNKKRIISQRTIEEINHETGEVTRSATENVAYMPSEPPYVKLYLDDVAKLYGLPKAGSDLLHALLRKMDYDGIITLVSSSKKRIADDIGVKQQTIDNNIQSLLKADILRRAGRGEFMFNPSLFAKGDWKNIYKQRGKYVELTVTYGTNGVRTVKGELKSN